MPDEKNPGRLRHVTRNEVIERYKVYPHGGCECIMESNWHCVVMATQVPVSTLSTWSKNFLSITASPKGSYSSKRNWSFVLYPELEQALYERFIRCRQEGKITRRIWFRLTARIEFKRIYLELDVNRFKFSSGWFNGFCARWEITFASGNEQNTGNPYCISWSYSELDAL